MNALLIWGGLCTLLTIGVNGGRGTFYERLGPPARTSSFVQPNPLSAPVTEGANHLPEDAAAPAPAAPAEDFHASDSEAQFTTTFLADIHEELGGSQNVFINSFGIWSVTSLIYSVSGGETEKDLAKILFNQHDMAHFTRDYRNLYDSIITSKANGPVQLAQSMFVVKKKETKLRTEVAEMLKKYFDAKEEWVDAKKPEESAKKINKKVKAVTFEKITDAVQKDDFNEFTALILSVAYFKGKWMHPFNTTATTYDEVFKDDKDRVIAQNVTMMRNKAIFKFGFSGELQSQVVELPYGDSKTSMVIFLPRRNLDISVVLAKMRGKTLHKLLPDMNDEDVDISLPKFKSSFSAALNRIYVKLGAARMLNDGAELPGFSDKEFISRIAHKAVIEVNEAGTVAAAATTAQVAYKTNVINFQANRPFIYFINDIPTRAVLFAGTYSKPATGKSVEGKGNRGH